MTDPVYELYHSHAYPAMSHPATDPSVMAVSAALAGLEVRPPPGSSILEIGCASGHNLLPLAARWPNCRFTGIDFSKSAIEDARETARLAEMPHVEFIEADLRDFVPGDGCGYDYIFAHGIYSWVPEDVQRALLDFCTKHLSSQGVALISYNTLPGWSLRKSIVDVTRNLLVRSGKQSHGEILALLAMATGSHTPYARHLNTVLHEMFGKGDDILPFDDFAPINDPCTFVDFVGKASQSGMRYLGESKLAENFPLDLATYALEVLHSLAAEPLLSQQMIDVLTNRKFRRSILCRSDAPVRDRIPATTVLNFSIRCPHLFTRSANGAVLTCQSGNQLASFDKPLAIALYNILSETKTQSVPIHEVIGQMADQLKAPVDVHSFGRMILDSARKNLVSLRYEPLLFDTVPPAYPNLGKLRLLGAQKGQPLVDQHHAPCLLNDARKQQIAVAMDGTNRIDALTTLANTIAPDFDFNRWLNHLAARGMFSSKENR